MDADGHNSDDEHYGGAQMRSRATGGGYVFEVCDRRNLSSVFVVGTHG